MERYWISTNLERCLLSMAGGRSLSLPHLRWSGEDSCDSSPALGFPRPCAEDMEVRRQYQDVSLHNYHPTNSCNCVSGILGESREAAQNPAEQAANAAAWSPAMPWGARIEAASHQQNTNGAPAAASLPTEGGAPGKRCRRPSDRVGFQKGLMFYELNHHSKSMRPAFPSHLQN